MKLLPRPTKLTTSTGVFTLNATTTISVSGTEEMLLPATQLADEIQTVAGIRPAVTREIAPGANSIVFVSEESSNSESYKLVVKPDRIILTGGGTAGVYYAAQTLRQIFRQSGNTVGCINISDQPDYPNRGFYHDCTRGKVPSRETLFKLVEMMAHYKLNQLQLYVEHTYRFKNYPDIWAGADPLTAEDILALDAHCLKHHIQLVPSLSTFGHFYTVLRSKRLEGLNELPIKASEKPFSFFDRMAHYTLDVSNPRSIKLVEELIEEYAALHSSKIFNICCDETFDLGKGRNKKLVEKKGEGEVYVSFLKKVMAATKRAGKTPMFWGDILLRSPEVMKKLPKNVIALNWDYGPDLKFGDSKAFAKAKMPFYVCPGVTGWNHWMNQIDIATANITRFAAQGKQYGAIGLLNTDWGDYGHVNLLANSYHGLILGAAASWNTRFGAASDYDASFSLLELGDSTGKTAGVLRKAGSLQTANWRNLSMWLSPSTDMDSWEREPVTGAFGETMALSTGKLLKQYTRISSLSDSLISLAGGARPQDALSYREFSAGSEGAILTAATVLLQKKAAGKKVPKLPFTKKEIADRWRLLEQEYSNLWHLRNKPSEYHRIQEVLLRTAEKLDGF